MSFLSDGTFFYKNAGQTWSQTAPAEGTYRFEVRGSDYYSNPLGTFEDSDEAQGKNRSELVTLQKLQEGRAFTFEFDFMVEPGSTNTADWLLLAQFHQTEDIAPDGTLIDTAAASPPLALQLRGERLEIVGRADQNVATTVSPPNIPMYLATDPITRGQFYNIRFEMVFDDAIGGAGRLQVFLDGTQIVNYTGPLGFNDAIGTYAQFGVYREQSPETLAAQFRNLSLTSNEPTPPINGTSGDDNLDADKVGFLENEVLNGYAGNDTLSGGYGNDTMNGGAGDDLYIVNSTLDVINERSGGVDQGGNDTVQSYVNWTLGLDTENLTLWAEANINGTGNAKDNIIRGNTGNNVLSGLGGHDSMLGDLGNDVVNGDDGNDTLLGGGGDDTLNGGVGDDRLMGEDGDDHLFGGDGNDTLESGAGDDTLEGGAGDDEYTIEHSADVIIEAADAGRDTIRASVSYDAGASGQIEVLNTADQNGTAAINLSGTDLDNEIRGNNGTNRLSGRAGNDLILGFNGNDTLDGGTGNDTLFGGTGNDSMVGGNGADRLEGEGGSDTLDGGIGDDSLYGGDGADSLYGGDGDNALYGGAANDLLQGGAGNDSMEGGAGIDTMEGGLGNDQYVVDGLGTMAYERAGEGSDTVRAAVSVDLGAANEVEFLSTTNQSGTTAIDLAGDDTANEIRGNDGANRLTGRGGDDKLFGYLGNDTLDGGNGADSVLGGDGNDSLLGGDGNDTLNGEAGNDTLYGGIGDDSLIGNGGNDSLHGDAGDDVLRAGEGNDTLFGGDGNDNLYAAALATNLNGGAGLDTLRGGGAADTMDGGAGDDTYYVVNRATQITEGAGGGSDTVRTTVSLALNAGAEVEFLRVDDQATTTAINLTGSASANELRGNNGNNRLDGGGGEDSLRGFLGNDTYIVDSAGDLVFEADGEGDDTILTSITYTLSSTRFVEHVHAMDAASTDGIGLTGNQIANDLRGNAGANRLSGADGDDTLTGLGGNDTIYGGNGTDRVVFGVASTTANAAAGASSMVLTTAEGADFIANDVEFFVFTDRTLTYAEAALLRATPVDPVLRGTAGADTLFGGSGDDTIYGVGGNDSLVGNDGNDQIHGEADNDILRGNAGSDTLYGGAGLDTLYGAADAADTMDGGAGDDTYYVEHSGTQITEGAGGGSDTVRTTVSLALNAGAEVEFLRVADQATTTAINLTGSASANELRGNNGNNRLDGGGGEDSLRGFLGNDTYIVDSAGDLVFEADGEGDDTILTSITYTLSSTRFVEHVHAMDAASTDGIGLTGNQIANDLRGNAGANRLSGADGDDTLTGLGGNDTVYGGNGTDRVVFGVASTTANAAAGASSMVLTTAEGADFIANDVEFFVFTDRTLTYAEAALLSASVGPAPVVGTAAAENVNGTSESELIQALGGNDWITPGTGSDTIDGGDGRDMVSFVNLPDTAGRTNVQYRLDLDLTTGQATTSGADVYTLSNVERVTGTIYADRIKGSAAADELRGLGDYDWFVATTGADTYDGGTGADMVSYVDWQNGAAGASVDPLLTNGRPPSAAITTGVVVDLGNTANNTNLAAGHSYIGIERITGSGRADVFWGDGNENDFRGLGDYDWFVGSTGGRERYFGGDGVDTVTYFRSTAGVTASLSNGARVNGLETGYGTGGDAARDLYFEIENLVGTDFADALRGNSGRNTLMGLDGDDFLFGAAGIDQLKGGMGNDTIDGGAGSDYAIYDGNRANYTLTKTASNTVTITGAEGTDSLIDVEYFRFADGDISIWSL